MSLSAENRVIEVCIICTLEKPFTDEHIIPEFMGGGLIFKNVCKACNDAMGGGFEGRLANSFIYNAWQYKNKIEGKSSPTHPLQGLAVDESSKKKFLIDNNGSFIAVPNIDVEENDSGMSASLSLDKNDIDKIKPLLEKKLIRHFKANGKNASNSLIPEGINRFLAQAITTEEEIKDLSIKKKFSIDFTDVELLHIKIAYELACYHFGGEYMADSIAEILRLTLYNQIIGSDIKAQTPMEDDPFDNFIDENYHYVIFKDCSCYVRALKFNSFIKFVSEDSSFCRPEGVVYKFCYKTKTHSSSDIMGMLTDHRAQQALHSDT